MDKLRLLKKLNDEGTLECLTSAELRIYFIMLAGSRKNGEGEIFADRLRWTFGEDFSHEKLAKICAGLEQKGLVVITALSSQNACGNNPGLGYRLLLAPP
ncbi:hypothetical protein [Geobacter sp. SVR]|uniref:hypothetical protein n=1 Tax=Geobacter sp. SVR TaxID=2495594 RepID=UPI00143EFD53|nr:hypothetical protein [Geobacter sp. SVR]BCS52059.1 hypothetical protein GSVR_03670 [Geobacter sp. SVR]GCF86514.1 hypothetical protein GSbR_31140 [Geobacter sp. SVR]